MNTIVKGGESLYEDRLKSGRKSIDFELKKIEKNGTFAGYASVFGVKDHYGDVVVKGAYKKTLAKWKKLGDGKYPMMLWQHNSAEVIGKFTLMKEDDYGLWVEGELIINSNIPLADKAYALLAADALHGMSIGYEAKLWEWNDDEETLYLKEIDLWEVSLVTFPANWEARVTQVKQLGELPTNIREFEGFLRDSGFSKEEAVRIASKGFNGGRESGQEKLAKSIDNAIQILKGL